MLTRIVVVFAKFPEPGRVKTRLIGPLTAAAAADVHLRCLQATLACVGAVEGVACVVAASPDDADFSALLGRDVRTVPQGEGNLGERLARVLGRAFAAGAGRVLAVGSDCPGMKPQDVSEAFALLQTHDCVIGPAHDGGYYLLGMRRFSPALLVSIDWSSPHVADQTRRQARLAGLTMAELAKRRDVDEYEDLVALASEIEENDRRLADMRRYLNELLRNGDRRG